MKKIMAGLALLAGTAMLVSEKSTAQMSGSTQLAALSGSAQSQMDHQLNLGSGDTVWGSTGGIVLSASNTSGVSSGLDIQRFEKRGRRVYAVVSLNDLMELQPTLTPSGLVSSGTVRLSSGSTMSGSLSGEDGGVSLRNNPSEYESPGWTISGDVDDDLDINLLPNGSGDDGGISLRSEPGEYESPGWTIGGDVDDDLDLNLLPGRSSSSVEYMDNRYSSFYNDYLSEEERVGYFISDSAPGVTYYFLDKDLERPSYVYDSRTGYFYDTESGYLYGSQVEFLTFDDDPMISSSLELAHSGSIGSSDALVAVPVAITGATCDDVHLALDLSAMHGTTIRTNNYRHVMPDRSLVTEGTLLPVTISALPAGMSSMSTPLASASMMRSDEGESSFCLLSRLVNGRGSTIAIVDQLNGLIGSSSGLTASR